MMCTNLNMITLLKTIILVTFHIYECRYGLGNTVKHRNVNFGMSGVL